MPPEGSSTIPSHPVDTGMASGQGKGTGGHDNQISCRALDLSSGSVEMTVRGRHRR